MAKLTDGVKRFIVQRLAMYDTPTEVAAAVKDEFNIEVSRQAVHVYDPTVGKDHAGKKWVDLFHATRATFLEDASNEAVSHRSVRLRWLGQMATSLKSRKNYMAAAQLLKQAAEEVGGVYTNRRELTGKNGEPLVPMTDDERLERVVGLMKDAAKRRDAAKGDNTSSTTPAQPKPAAKKKERASR